MPVSNPLVKAALEFGKKMAFRHTAFGAPNYPYPNVEPIELATLIMQIERLRGAPGVILEIGVARGMTTRFMAEHIRASGSGDRIIAIDTFSSFIASDVNHEVDKRGKRRFEITAFGYNDFEVWKRNFQAFDFVSAVQADCATLDYAAIGPVKLAFLDVDLYLPTQKTLPRIYEKLIAGGIILVDDVAEGGAWDGAYQAYVEFCGQNDLPLEIVGNKCGIVRKP